MKMSRDEADATNAFWEMARHRQRDRWRKAAWNIGLIVTGAGIFGVIVALVAR